MEEIRNVIQGLDPELFGVAMTALMAVGASLLQE